MSSKIKQKAVKRTETKSSANKPFVFKKENYILLIASVLVITIGFIVMGSASDKPFDDPTKITVAPLIVLAGFALGVVSILYSPKEKNQEVNN
jgi:hypothetical protein